MCCAIALIVTSCALQGAASRVPTSPEPSRATSPASPGEISRDQAIARGREALREAGEEWHVVRAQSGQLASVRPGWEEVEWGLGLSGDLRVWRLVMTAGSLSAEVIIDATDGKVYGSVIGIAD
jgi:hypothetical protein